MIISASLSQKLHTISHRQATLPHYKKQNTRTRSRNPPYRDCDWRLILRTFEFMLHYAHPAGIIYGNIFSSGRQHLCFHLISRTFEFMLPYTHPAGIIYEAIVSSISIVILVIIIAIILVGDATGGLATGNLYI